MRQAVWYLFAVMASVSVGQVLLKYGVNLSLRRGQKGLVLFIQPFVILGYLLLFLSSVFNLLAYKRLPIKLFPIAGAGSIILVFFLSKCFLKENVNVRQWQGLALVIVGMLVFFS